MTYEEIRPTIRSGDIVLVKSRGFWAKMIRFFTGESYSHVAMFLTSTAGVFIVEMREKKGWQMMPASQWMKENEQFFLFYGICPEDANRGNACHEYYALHQRAKKYSYITLIKIWLSQMFNVKLSGNLVCSTFVQGSWEHCGYTELERLCDVGDFTEHAHIIPIR